MTTRTGRRPRLSAVVLLACALAATWLVFGSVPAGAATTNVNCPPYGAASLQSAITAASPGDTLDIHGTCVGNFTVAKNLTLQGVTSGAGLNGNAAGTTLTVSGGVVATIKSLVIANGKAPGGGGGIRAIGNGTAVIVMSSAVSGNAANPNNFGGGIDMVDDGQTLTLIGSTVSNNVARGGGGIAIEGDNGSVTLNSSSLSGNNAGSTQGGGILDFGTGNGISLSGSSISGNIAGGGGGI